MSVVRSGPEIAGRGSSPLVRLELVSQDRPKQNPTLAVELHHLELLIDAPIIRFGGDRHARQRKVRGVILDVCRLLHDIGAREIVTALLEYVY